MFLYGSVAAAQGSAMATVLGSIAVGFVAALVSYAVLRAGAKVMPWRGFFRLSEVMLLLLGCALFVTGVGDLVAAGVLPFMAPLWDTSVILDDSTRFGGLVAALTGYRSAPDAVIVSAWLLYWGTVLGLLRLQAAGLRARALRKARAAAAE